MNYQTQNYRFNENRHLHQIYVDGKWENLTGITTILNVISKPFLIQWSANMAVDYVRDNLKDLKDLDEVLQEARIAHRKKKEKAGEQGTDIHAIAEEIIKKAIKETNGIIQETEHEKPQIKHFLNWTKKNNVKFLESELHIYSEDKFLGGICDFVCEIDGKKWVGDIKTSSDIHFEAFVQVAGYQVIMQDMGIYPDIAGYVILNLKKDGTFKEKRSALTEESIKAFLSALSLYRIKEKTEKTIL
jgi:hypothetical protein